MRSEGFTPGNVPPPDAFRSDALRSIDARAGTPRRSSAAVSSSSLRSSPQVPPPPPPLHLKPFTLASSSAAPQTVCPCLLVHWRCEIGTSSSAANSEPRPFALASLYSGAAKELW
eukprot:5929343-Prymnesium_polylepis.2